MSICFEYIRNDIYNYCSRDLWWKELWSESHFPYGEKNEYEKCK
jgi:hypothetical protein